MVDDAHRDRDGLIGLICCDVGADVTPESCGERLVQLRTPGPGDDRGAEVPEHSGHQLFDPGQIGRPGHSNVEIRHGCSGPSPAITTHAATRQSVGF